MSKQFNTFAQLFFKRVNADVMTLRPKILLEELEALLESELDELADALEGKKYVSATKSKALRRLVPLLERELEVKLPPSRHYSTKPNVGDDVMSIDGNTGAKMSPKPMVGKPVSKPAAKPVSKPAAKPVSKPAAKPVSKPAAKPVSKPAVGKGSRAVVGGFKRESKITVLVKQNPKRAGSSSAKRFDLYKRCKTVGDYITAGGHSGDLQWDADHKFISIK